MGPKVEMEGGVLILGKDTGWVGRRRVAQIAGWREGFGVWEKSQQAYLHLGKMAVAALVGAGVEAEAVADIKGRVDCGALSPSEPEEFTPGLGGGDAPAAQRSCSCSSSCFKTPMQ